MAKEPTVEQAVNMLKWEVLEDVRAGRVPNSVTTYSELHDFVDANVYQVFEDAYERLRGDEDEDLPDELVDFVNEVQGQVDVWLAQGALKGFDADPFWDGWDQEGFERAQAKEASR